MTWEEITKTRGPYRKYPMATLHPNGVLIVGVTGQRMLPEGTKRVTVHYDHEEKKILLRVTASPWEGRTFGSRGQIGISSFARQSGIPLPTHYMIHRASDTELILTPVEE